MYTKRVIVGRRRRSLLGLGDGPITSPSQVDVPVRDPDTSVLIGEVTNPRRVACEELAPDDPWRGPGGPCAPQTGMFDWLKNLFSGLTPSTPATTTPVVTPPVATESMLPRLALLAALGGGAYYLYTKKKRST